MQSKSDEGEKFSKPVQDVVPYNGLYNDGYYNRRVGSTEKFKTLEDLNQEEGIVNNGMINGMNNGMADGMKDVKDMKKDEPQYWLFDNFSKKFDLLLMTKILLKLIIFKKIVKFIALVCLLFFIPALKDDSTDDSKRNLDDMDVYGEIDSADYSWSLNNLLAFRSNWLSNEGNFILCNCISWKFLYR